MKKSIKERSVKEKEDARMKKNLELDQLASYKLRMS